MEDEDIEAVVRSYFSAEEWDNLADILKIRYSNMYRNFVSIPGAESFMPLPEFMQRGKKREKESASTSKKLDVNRNEIKASKRKTTEDVRIENRYPKRGVPKINYHEEEEPGQDRYVFCDNCGQEYLDFCSKCGRLIILRDFPVPLGTEGRAKKTLPKGVLEIRPSPIHGLGVFASGTVKKGVQMGPYEGNITRVDTTNGYAWKLRDGRLIDGSDESNSNWLRYVNCARTVTEQNVVAFQYRGFLYYRSIREIKKDEELLVYYGQSFAQILGIDTKQYFHPAEEEVQKDFFCCRYCQAGLSTADFRNSHERWCRFKPYMMAVCEESYVCKYCSYVLTTKEYQETHEMYCRQKNKTEKKSEQRGEVEVAQKKHQCSYCDYAFTSKGNLDIHITTIHQKYNAQIFECKECEYKTYRKDSLRRHIRTHSKNGIFKCIDKDCERAFNHKRLLDNHIFKHHQHMDYFITSKIYSCHFCEYKSVISTHLSDHINVRHLRENGKKYVCDKCGYYSLMKSHLTRHLYVHSVERRFTCVVCKNKFIQKGDLDSHILNNHHTNAELLKTITSKIHHCEICPYRAIRVTDLKRHIKARHSS